MSPKAKRGAASPPPRKRATPARIAPPAKRLLSVREAAADLGVGERTVWRLVRLGDIASITVGSRRMVPRQCIDEYIERQLSLAASA